MLVLVGPAVANDAQLEIRESHWIEAMRIGRVDSEILYAISLQESGTSFNGMRQYGPWPWTMNISNEPRYYSSRGAARLALEKEVDSGNNRIAVGMWQIYLRYNAHYVEDPLDLIDPVTNLRVAAEVLRDCGNQYQTTHDVLSCYHSGDVDDAGRDYAERVLRLARKWGQPFRMASTPPEVRFTHDGVSNVTNAPAVRVVSIDGVSPETDERMSDEGTKLSVVANTSDSGANTLLNALSEVETTYVQRVIVVE